MGDIQQSGQVAAISDRYGLRVRYALPRLPLSNSTDTSKEKRAKSHLNKERCERNDKPLLLRFEAGCSKSEQRELASVWTYCWHFGRSTKEGKIDLHVTYLAFRVLDRSAGHQAAILGLSCSNLRRTRIDGKDTDQPTSQL